MKKKLKKGAVFSFSVTINIRDHENSFLGMRRSGDISLEATKFCDRPSSTGRTERWRLSIAGSLSLSLRACNI